MRAHSELDLIRFWVCFFLLPLTGGCEMPVTIKKLKSGKYQVSTPKGVHAKSTTKKKAIAQEKIINAAHAGHPFATGKPPVPTRKKG
jgi:hypothetical protein